VPDFEFAVFENKFPALRRQPPAPAISGNALHPVRPSRGVCEVILYTAAHEGTLTDQPVETIRRLIEVWTDRYQELGSLPGIRYVYIFENKGDAIGVTLTHPHGQIYAFPFIPPVIARELRAARRHHRRTGRCLFCDVVADELAAKERILFASRHFVVAVPFYAHWPYETHVWARGHRLSLTDLSGVERQDLARVLKRLLVAFDHLWDRSLPYMMVMHQSPTDGRDHSHDSHFHIEFYPPYRARDKLKYLASVESGAGTFLNDTLPEQTAAELRQADRRGRGRAS